MKHSSARSVALLMAVAFLMSFSGTASADEASGSGDFYDDWNNNHSLCSTCTVDFGNIVGLWQNVLWADGFLAACGSSGIDGDYGPVTSDATTEWKDWWNVGGTAGHTGTYAWEKANNRLFPSSGPGDNPHTYVGYTGEAAYSRQSSGAWKWIRAGRPFYYANFNPSGHDSSINFTTC